MRHLRYVLLVAATVVACKSPPRGDGGDGASRAMPGPEAVKPAPLQLDAALLIEEVQALRDREFVKAPEVLAVARYTEEARCVDACRNERVLLSDVLFGRDVEQAARVAHFDRTKNAVLYDASVVDPTELEFAVVAALVEGLDRQTGAPLPEPTSWDEFLAREAVARGAGVFVAALRRGRQLASKLDASALAAHPESLFELAPKSVVADFSRREGFALAAAMYRSSGWSAVELLRNEPPSTTAGVVRPDRYLEGADYGRWTFPTDVDGARQADGWVASGTGRVGPTVFVEWLSGHVDPRVARAAYLGLESDAYRMWRRGEQWSWEWVTLWNTPDTAQQVVEILDAALRTQKEARRYSVVRRGATIAVVGSNTEDDNLGLATGLVEARPSFQPSSGAGLVFVPTPADELASKGLEAKLEANRWEDPATGLRADLSPLTAWKVQRTDETGIRWFAKHADGSLLELTTEVASVLAPAFGSAAHEKALMEAFRSSVAVEGEVVSKRVDLPAPGTVRLDLTGTIDEGARRTFRVWHFARGPYLVTVSLQASPAAFAARRAEVEPVVQAIVVPADEEPGAGGGVIKFTVEE